MQQVEAAEQQLAAAQQMLEELEKLEATAPPTLLSLSTDAVFAILDFVGGADLCSCARVSRAFELVAHDDLLWLPIVDRLPARWSRPLRLKEPRWRYALRVRAGLYLEADRAWQKLLDHRSGRYPFLAELGAVHADRGEFVPDRRLSSRLKYGAVCELVQLAAARDGGAISHRSYRAAAEEMGSWASEKTATPPDLHMVVREIYKTCHPGFGAAAGASSSWGMGETGTIAGVVARKGVAGRARRASGDLGSSPTARSPPSMAAAKAADEELRKRLEMWHLCDWVHAR